MTFGERVRLMRETESLTAKEVAMRAGVSPQYLCDIERDRRVCPLETAKRIADAVDCDVAALDPLVSVPLSWVNPERRSEVLA
jgi:transcriptional regulator with XRE-family HTH domain